MFRTSSIFANVRGQARLVPKLEAVVRHMLDSGELTATCQRVIGELLRPASEGLAICDEDYARFESSADSGGGVPAAA